MWPLAFDWLATPGLEDRKNRIRPTPSDQGCLGGGLGPPSSKKKFVGGPRGDS